jgi:hypothetical protein
MSDGIGDACNVERSAYEVLKRFTVERLVPSEGSGGAEDARNR